MNQNETRKEKKNKKRIRNLNVEMNNHKENCVRKKKKQYKMNEITAERRSRYEP